MDYDGVKHMTGFIVPQQVYRATQPYVPLKNVTFKFNGVLGFKLSDAIRMNTTKLDNADSVPCLAETAKKTTLRIIVRVLLT